MVFCNLTKNERRQLNSSHNPYFNRWFSAIGIKDWNKFFSEFVTILILIDGFLQFVATVNQSHLWVKSQSLF